MVAVLHGPGGNLTPFEAVDMVARLSLESLETSLP